LPGLGFRPGFGPKGVGRMFGPVLFPERVGRLERGIVPGIKDAGGHGKVPLRYRRRFRRLPRLAWR